MTRRQVATKTKRSDHLRYQAFIGFLYRKPEYMNNYQTWGKEEKGLTFSCMFEVIIHHVCYQSETASTLCLQESDHQCKDEMVSPSVALQPFHRF